MQSQYITMKKNGKLMFEKCKECAQRAYLEVLTKMYGEKYANL